jgi:hypothetical protein
MGSMAGIRQAQSRPWIATLASLLPLWLLSLAVTAEGFPRPLLSIELAFAALILAIVSGVALLGMNWMTVEVLLYSFTPLAFVIIFDEITTTIKTPFILLSALILTAGILTYHGSRRSHWRALVLLFTFLFTMFAAANAANNFWAMHNHLGIGECFMDAHGCPPLPSNATTWWKLFFNP